MDIKKRYQELMADLETNLESKKDFEYIQNSFSGIIFDFFSELDENYNYNKEKMEQLEERLEKIEKELYITDEDDENYDFEIVCPYCNCEFEIELNELKQDVKCPECHNVIELDWNEEDGCHGECSCCHGGCEEDVDESDGFLEVNLEEKDEDDDM